MINYQSTKLTVTQKQRHLNDGVLLYVNCTDSNIDSVTMKLVMFTGETFEETHALHNGKTRFNLSEYQRETMPLDYARLLYNTDNALQALSAGIPAVSVYNTTDTRYVRENVGNFESIKIVAGETEHSLTTNDLEIDYGYTKYEETPAVHLFNPNYETIAEMTCSHPEDNVLRFGLTYNKANGNDTCWYQYDNPSQGANSRIVAAFKLNDYWDDRYNSEGLTLDFTPNGETTERYLIDTRTKGVFLRFLDSNGRLQQLLLDEESQENAYSDGDLIVTYEVGTRHWENNTSIGVKYLAGHNQTAQRTHTKALHCSINNVPEELESDIMALAISPIVLMYRGKDGDDTPRWEQVRVVTEQVMVESKKRHITAKFDVYPIFENTARV